MSSESQTFYLLGQRLGKQSDSSSLQRYISLIEECKNEGEFLSFETVSDWLTCYAGDAQPIQSKLPLLVFRPHAVFNISFFIRACFEKEIPVTVRCGGTGLSGSCVPAREGVILLTGHLNQIKNYDGKRGFVSVEPGVTVRELNRAISGDGWHFPLSLATEGVAGIAGCLSCNSRGYHQQHELVYDLIEEVTLVDGQGQIIDVPGALVCGAEGLWGVIIEIKISLKKKSQEVQQFRYQGHWKDVLTKLPMLRSISTLTGAIWLKDVFYFKLEGDTWRLPSASTDLKKCLPGIMRIETSLEKISQTFLSSRRMFVAISTLFQTDQLPDALTWSIEQAQALQLECLQMTDLLAGSLHLILQKNEELYPFTKAIDEFLVEWINYLDSKQGILAGTHGIGMQLRHYMTPFWKEESQKSWRKLQMLFDPKELFAKERFFPMIGKSLEKVSACV